MTDTPYGPAGAGVPAARIDLAESLSEKGRGRLTVAGILLIVAGLGAIATALVVVMPNPFAAMSGLTPSILSGLVVIIGSLGVVVGTVGAYIAFLRAGFPRRSALMTWVTIGIVVVYALMPVTGGALTFTGGPWGATLPILAAVGGALLLVFTISAARNRALPPGLRVVPVMQFALVVVGYATGYVTQFPVTGVAYLAAGIAYVVLASQAVEDVAVRSPV